jgi:hypothetical protein
MIIHNLGLPNLLGHKMVLYSLDFCCSSDQIATEHPLLRGQDIVLLPLSARKALFHYRVIIVVLWYLHQDKDEDKDITIETH